MYCSPFQPWLLINWGCVTTTLVEGESSLLRHMYGSCWAPNEEVQSSIIKSEMSIEGEGQGQTRGLNNHRTLLQKTAVLWRIHCTQFESMKLWYLYAD